MSNEDGRLPGRRWIQRSPSAAVSPREPQNLPANKLPVRYALGHQSGSLFVFLKRFFVIHVALNWFADAGAEVSGPHGRLTPRNGRLYCRH